MNAALDIYKSALPRPKGPIANQNNNNNNNNY